MNVVQELFDSLLKLRLAVLTPGNIAAEKPIHGLPPDFTAPLEPDPPPRRIRLSWTIPSKTTETQMTKGEKSQDPRVSCQNPFSVS